MSAKVKAPADWVAEFPDDLETKSKKLVSDSLPIDVLACKYCSTEIDVLGSGKKSWDRVNEHVKSKRHNRMKDNYRKGR